jgi:hypothetical protein
LYILTGLHKSIEYSMMIAGHTKFEPDWHFGVWKLRWRNSTAETQVELLEHDSYRNSIQFEQRFYTQFLKLQFII